MTTIDDIPPELLYRITRVGSVGLPEAERRQFLRTFSLVCREWQHPGQSELWHFVKLGEGSVNMEDPLLYAESEGTRRGLVTREMGVNFNYGAVHKPVRELEEAIRSSHGLEGLALIEVSGLDPRVFQGENMADLRRLWLRHCNLEPSPPTVPLPFRLDFLSICFHETIPDIFSSLLQPSLETGKFLFCLHDTNYDSAFYEQFLSTIDERAPALRTLMLHSNRPHRSEDLYTRLYAPLVERLPELLEFGCNFEALASLANCSAKLRTLEVSINTSEDYLNVAEFFGKEYQCVESLQVLTIRRAPGGGGVDQVEEERSALETMCKKRQITVEVLG